MSITQLQEQCPWSHFEKVDYPFCEEQLCQWVAQPANTWTNIAYLIVGFLTLKDTKLNKLKYFFGWGAIALGLSSALLHSTAAIWAKYMDVISMLFIACLLLGLSSQRYFKLNPRPTIFIFFTSFLITNAILFYTGTGGIVFVLTVIAALFIEYLHLTKELPNRQKSKTKYIYKAAGLFLIAAVFQVLDKNKVLCWPDNHILSGHGIWHLLTAVCIYLAAKYYTTKKSM